MQGLGGPMEPWREGEFDLVARDFVYLAELPGASHPPTSPDQNSSDQSATPARAISSTIRYTRLTKAARSTSHPQRPP
jgi:hypothetical protein